jgi:hypothetical protein
MAGENRKRKRASVVFLPARHARTEKRWNDLAAEAVMEQDPGKFLAIVRELNDLLEAKRGRIEALRSSPDKPPSR